MKKIHTMAKYSPAWVVFHGQDTPSFRMALIERIRNGVKKTDWKEMLTHLGATEKEFEFILPSSISSMQKKSVYDRETSERIYEISRLFNLGFEVFDTPEDFRQWLLTPCRGLGARIPFALLDSSFGFELVGNELVRIQHNVYS